MKAISEAMPQAYGSSVAQNATVSWNVPSDGETVQIDLGTRFLSLTRGEALALEQALNSALPHMAVSIL